MITFNSETSFTPKNQNKLAEWISNVILYEGFEVGEINYIFCDDIYLHKINQEFLKHDTYTDIISFDYTLGKEVGGDIFVSIERVLENAEKFNEVFENELHRVMIHGVLHFMGYKDKTKKDKILMRTKENEKISIISS
ncbi:rRNA maturation RNase YbeY [Flavobacteriaceae bacterium]|nr:rRNA maturation RNase YbeY [Flavobacteriaceae bacterium]